MQQEISTESQISEYFKTADDLHLSEADVVRLAMAQITAQKGFVTNKDVIFYLLQKLESENDVVQLDIYRNALELVVQRTPDDSI